MNQLESSHGEVEDRPTDISRYDEKFTNILLTLVLLDGIHPAFANSVVPDQLASEEAN